LLEDELCPDVEMNQTAKILWSVMNGAARRKSLTYAERRLYERIDTGLGRLAEGVPGEPAKGWPHPEIRTNEVRVMETFELLKLLRETVESHDHVAIVQSEINFYFVLKQALELYPYEAANGCPEPNRCCRICGAPLKDCLC
jgi:hypothetical protein